MARKKRAAILLLVLLMTLAVLRAPVSPAGLFWGSMTIMASEGGVSVRGQVGLMLFGVADATVKGALVGAAFGVVPGAIVGAAYGI